jgi:thymidylate synthase
MYAEFIARVREVLKNKLSEEEEKKVFQKVLNRCIREGILREFLIEHSSEVINMIFTEWNWDDYWEVKREEFLEEGIEKGYKKAKAEFGKQMRQSQEQIRQSQEQIRQLEEKIRRLEEQNTPRV